MRMPRSIRVFRLATALGAALMVAVLVLGNGGTGARVAAAFVLAFAALQWLFLGALVRTFSKIGDSPGGGPPSNPGA